MATDKHLYIGLMSGTSMDSIDAALLDFTTSAPRILSTHRTTINNNLKQRLLALCGHATQPKLGEMDIEMGENFARAALQLISNTGIDKQKISAIGSHGQTIFHQPPSHGKHGFSVQIGDPNIIALQTGITTVADFRRKDMAAGGQGAPLVPAFHRAVFYSGEKNHVIVNIGGIANITVLHKNGRVTGFDTGPGNVLLDAWISKHQNQAYDDHGNWAKQGTTHDILLNRFLADDFFSMAPPKSTGRERFNTSWLEKYLATHKEIISAVDVQATLTALTAKSISDAIQHHAPLTDEIYVCGGGVHNVQLMNLLKKFSGINVHSTSALGIDPGWVEASAFAWLAKQTMEGKPGNLPEVTGASRPVVLGGIYPP